MITSELVARGTFGSLYNSSSSSILVSIVGILLSELPRSFEAPMSAWPRLLRTVSSNPGREARCFLKGEATELEELGSVDGFAGADDGPSFVEQASGAGVPDRGDPEASDTEGPTGRPTGSAECWRLS